MSNVEVKGFNKVSSDGLFVSGNISLSGTLSAGSRIVDVDSSLIFSSAFGSIVISGNLSVAGGSVSQNGSPISVAGATLSSSDGRIISSGSIEILDASKNYSIRAINSDLILTSSAGSVVVSGNLVVTGSLHYPATPDSFKHTSGSAGYTSWYVVGQNSSENWAAASVFMNRMVAAPFIAPSRGGRVGTIATDVTAQSAVNPSIGMLGVYDNISNSNIFPNKLLYSCSFTTTTTGLKEGSANLSLQPGKLYWAVSMFSGGVPSIRQVVGGRANAFLGNNFAARGTNGNCSVILSTTGYDAVVLPTMFPLTGNTASNGGGSLVLPVFAILYAG